MYQKLYNILKSIKTGGRNMSNMEKALDDLRLVRLCTGKGSRVKTSHRNQINNAEFAGINSNIMISIAKLNDVLDEREEDMDAKH